MIEKLFAHLTSSLDKDASLCIKEIRRSLGSAGTTQQPDENNLRRHHTRKRGALINNYA